MGKDIHKKSIVNYNKKTATSYLTFFVMCDIIQSSTKGGRKCLTKRKSHNLKNKLKDMNLRFKDMKTKEVKQ